MRQKQRVRRHSTSEGARVHSIYIRLRQAAPVHGETKVKCYWRQEMEVHRMEARES